MNQKLVTAFIYGISIPLCLYALTILSPKQTVEDDASLRGLSILTAQQGGTGIGSTTAGHVGDCLVVLDDSPFKYEIGNCGGASSGTVTSVAQTVPTGFTISGSPVTTSGTLAIGFNTGYELFKTASGTNWNNFYNTPSNRITAGTNLSWSGNTLNATGGAGGGSISTSTVPVAGNLAYWTSGSALSDVATGTLTETATGLELSATRGLVGGASILSLTSGYTIPLTASTTEWATASGTVKSVAMTVPTGLSITGTPITTSGTLALTYASGYEGFLTSASTTLFGFYNTPSTRITDGTGLTWSGNTLNVDASQNITTLSNLTGNGFVKTSGGTGALSIDTSTYLTTVDISANTNLTGGAGLTLTNDDMFCDTGSGSVFGCITSTDWTTFNNKVSSTSIDTSAELASLLTDETGSGNVVFSASPLFTGTLSFASATSSGSSTIASLTATNATTSLLKISGLKDSANSFGTNGMVLQTNGSTAQWVATSTLGLGGAGGGTVTSVDMSVPTGFSISGNPVTTNGTLALTYAAGYGLPLTASTTNWNGFYDTPSTRITAGTGIDWSGNTLNGVYTAGDALTLTGEDFDFDGGATPSGDLGGTWASPSVTDDSHAHTGTTLSGIDISADTNLSADGTEIVLTGDALSLGTELTFTNATSSTSFFSALGTFTNLIVNTLSTFLNVVVTGLLDIGGGVLEIPNGTAPTVDSIGELALDSTSNQLVLYGTTKKVIGNGNIYPAFTYATTTAWTGTTTIPLGTAYVAETWNAVQCFTDTGTVNVDFGDGTNFMNATTSRALNPVPTHTLSTNNTFTAGETRYARVGTPASSPTKISCTVSKSITAD